jgi:thiamine biosynthesis lipoprotein ApbE
MDADALATGVFVMPPTQGVAFVRALSGCDCFIIGAHGEQWCTPGWRSAARTTERKAEL